jgi:hypothetical protein
MNRWMACVALWGLVGCGNGAASEVESDLVDPEELDLAEVLPGTWTGVEESPTIGQLTATYVISDEGAGRLDVTLEGQTRRKFFVEVGLGTPDSAFARVPEQIYAEGQTGPVEIVLVGTGAFGQDAAGGPYDAVYRLAEDAFSLEGTVTTRGNTEAFTFDFTR